MKKLIIFLFIFSILGAGAIVGTGYWLGQETNKMFEKQYDNLSLSGQFSFDDRVFNGGIFQSKSKVSTCLKGKFEHKLKEYAAKSGTPFQPLCFITNNVINHNPITKLFVKKKFNPRIALVYSKIDLDEPYNEITVSIYDDAPLKVKTEVYLNGNMKSWLNSPAFDYTNSKKVHIVFNGFDGVFNYNNNSHAFNGKYNFNGLAINDKTSHVKIDSMTTLLKQKIDLENFSTTGKSLTKISEINFKIKVKEQPEPIKFKLKQLNLLGSTRIAEDSYVFFVDIKYDNIQLNNYWLKEGYIKTQMDHVDSASFDKLQKISQNVEAMQAQELMNLKQDFMQNILPQLLSKSPNLLLSLGTKSNLGTMKGYFKVKYNAAKMGASFSIANLTKALSAKAHVAIPATIIKQMVAKNVRKQLTMKLQQSGQDQQQQLTPEQVDQMIDMSVEQQLTIFESQKLIIKNGNLIVSKAIYKDGKLVVNGNELPIMDMLMGMSAGKTQP